MSTSPASKGFLPSRCPQAILRRVSYLADVHLACFEGFLSVRVEHQHLTLTLVSAHDHREVLHRPPGPRLPRPHPHLPVPPGQRQVFGWAGHRAGLGPREGKGELLFKRAFLVSTNPAVENKERSKVKNEGRNEMFYLTTHSKHLIYGYMASDIW